MPTLAHTPHIGVVVQRYGDQIVGGAEAHARMLAHHLAKRARVTVLTSCAAEWETWRNAYPAGESQDGPVRVRRFPTAVPRLGPAVGLLGRALDLRPTRALARRAGKAFALAQGPTIPGLLPALDTLDVHRVIFVCYLYYPTIAGMPRVARRGIPVDFIPTAHDERPFRFAAMQQSFHLAHRIACNTEPERALIRRVVGVPAHKLSVVGCGTDYPGKQNLPKSPDDPACRINAPYILYLGRQKDGVELLAPAMAHHQTPVTLVCAGSARVNGAVNLGRVTDRDKWYLLKNALAVVQPSFNESLGLTLIEAWQVKCPVLVNRQCEVLRAQAETSGAGLSFEDPRTLARAVERLAGDPRLCEELGSAGQRYAETYSWKKITDFYLSKV